MGRKENKIDTAEVLEKMISSDAAQALAVLFLYMAMMLWGVFQTFWPAEPDVNLPGGGHKVRKGLSRRIARHSPKVP